MAKPYPSFAALNAVERPFITNKVDLESNSAAALFGTLTKESLTINSIRDLGPFRAICLRVERSALGVPYPGSYESAAHNHVEGIKERDKPSLLRIIARIPEIHSMIPPPNFIGNDAEGSDQDIIEMHPTFLSSDLETSNKPVEAGDIVMVNYGNLNNLTEPIYLGPVFKTSDTPP